MNASRPPAEPGMSLEDVDTPALVIDLSLFEKNMDVMAQAARDGGLMERPISARSLVSSRWPAVPLVFACKRSTKPRL